MLTVPLLLGLVIVPGWHWRVIPLLAAALAFFLLRYPLATLVKTRRRPGGERTYLISWAGIYGGIAVLCGGWLALAHNLWWLLPLALLGGLLLLFHLWLVYRRQEMSIIGELAGILGLALGAPLAYYTISGQLDGVAAALWLVNALYFGGTVFYIKLKVRQQPRLPAPDRVSERLVKAKACLAYQTIALSTLLLLVAWQWLPWLALLAFVPVTLKVVHGAWQWQDKKSLSLMRLGLIEIFHAGAFAVLVMVAFV